MSRTTSMQRTEHGSRWRRRTLAALLATALVAAGCGVDDPEEPEEPTDEPADTDGDNVEGDDATAQDFSGETLSFLAAQPQAGAAELLAERFEEETGATVEFTVVPYDEIQATAILDVQSGAAEYDVFQYWYTSVGALAEGGVFADITEFIESSDALDQDDYLGAIYDPYSLYEGARYGIPFDGDYHILFYNTEIFDRVGVEPPTTWDEYVEVAEAITDELSGEGIYGAALLGRNTAFDIGSSFFNRLATTGGTAITDGEPTLDTPEGVEAAEAMYAVVDHALPTPIETGFDTALPEWLAGNVGMMEFWTDLGAFSQDPEGSEIVDQWAAAPLPVGPSGEQAAALNAGWGFAISTATEQRELAEAFLEFAGSQSMNEELSTTTGSGIDPTYSSTLSSDAYTEFAPEVQEVASQVAANAQPWPTVPESPELIQILNDELGLMLQGSKTPAEAIADAQAGWEQALD